MLLKLIDMWHNKMNMPIESLDWYQEKIDGELAELATARTLLNELSERADVLYSYTRAQHDGMNIVFEDRERFLQTEIVIYMILKLSLRRLFYIRVGSKLVPPKDMKALRNPKKLDNLIGLAHKHGYDEATFVATAVKQRKYWPLLP